MYRMWKSLVGDQIYDTLIIIWLLFLLNLISKIRNRVLLWRSRRLLIGWNSEQAVSQTKKTITLIEKKRKQFHAANISREETLEEVLNIYDAFGLAAAARPFYVIYWLEN
jgi:hypothetical protein